MRILLVATNRHNRCANKDEVRPLPIGLAYIAAYLDNKRHDVRLLDLMFSESCREAVAVAAREFQPEVVGLSIRNLDNGSYIEPESALPLVRDVVTEIRRNSSATIVCGGPAFSILPQEMFRYLQPDVGLAGDAPEAFSRLVSRLSKGKGFTDLPGAVYAHNGGVRMAPARAASQLTRPPRLEDLDLRRYREAGFGVGVITKLTGYAGASAANGNGNGSSPAHRVVRPVDDVITELRRLQKKFGVQEVFFIDTAFNQPVAYAKELCQRIIDENLSIRWNTNLRPPEHDSELVGLMVKAGCRLALLGGVNVSPMQALTPHPPPDTVKLATDLVALQNLCDQCYASGLPFAITQGFGEMGETFDTVRTKLAFLSSAAGGERRAQVTLRVGNRLLPGSKLAEQARYEDLIKSEQDLLMPVFYIARPVRQGLVEILQSAAQSNPNWRVM